jgi:hypothetical protein
LRLSADFAERYASAAASAAAFNVPLALSMALLAREDLRDAEPDLAPRMAAVARRLTPDLGPEIWSLLADGLAGR